MKIRNWINKGEGGEWYEPFVTNEDLVYIGIITAIVCTIIIGGGFVLSKFYYL
jgi:hypothetical protein